VVADGEESGDWGTPDREDSYLGLIESAAFFE
jgi:hypothetical protein